MLGKLKNVGPRSKFGLILPYARPRVSVARGRTDPVRLRLLREQHSLTPSGEGPTLLAQTRPMLRTLISAYRCVVEPFFRTDLFSVDLRLQCSRAERFTFVIKQL